MQLQSESWHVWLPDHGCFSTVRKVSFQGVRSNLMLGCIRPFDCWLVVVQLVRDWAKGVGGMVTSGPSYVQCV